ncbi:MAG: hypothetical protein QOH17_2254 [Pseudonocardiales bacterium]|jgi:hypothetical protein|nr:hypothetical protein [Pseudonocardiales bacterium]
MTGSGDVHPAQAEGGPAPGGPRDHEPFAGRLDLPNLRWAERFAVRGVRMTAAGFRDPGRHMHAELKVADKLE